METFKIPNEEEQQAEKGRKSKTRRLGSWIYNAAGSMGQLYWLRKDRVHNTRVWFNTLLSSYFKLLRSKGNLDEKKTEINNDRPIEIQTSSADLFPELQPADTSVFIENNITVDVSKADQIIIPLQEIVITPNRSVAALLNERFYTKENSLNKKDVTTTHYVDKKFRISCISCREKFTYRRRPKHCRRCGEVFCGTCVQFQRRLNALAQLDPDGIYKKVCQKCYKDDSQGIGRVRSLSVEFQKEREQSKCERIAKQRVYSKTQTFWRDQLDVEVECRRLLEGFERYVGQAEPYKAVEDIQSYMAVPFWQRSKYWQVENMARTCRQCKQSFGFRKSKRNCKVCSLALCKQCSYKELLIYYDDYIQKGHRAAHLALINVAGCPSIEPNISLLLYVCSDCKTFIQEKQEDNHSWYERLRNDSPLAEINRKNVLFEELTSQITKGLQNEIQVEIEKCNKTSNKGSQIMTLLGTHLDEYHTLYKSIETLLGRAETKQQFLFIKNFKKGKYDFYMEACDVFRTLSKEPRGEK